MPGIAVLVALPLQLLWALVLATGGGDLAAQLAWAGFAARHPGSAYNLSWYGGAHPANYSLLTPHLMAALGVRTVTVAAGVGAAGALGLLCVRGGVRWPVAVSVLGSLTLWCNTASGRTTFAVGVALGLVALLSVRRRAGLAAGWAAVATAASPVAGLFLVVVGAAYGLGGRWRRGAALVVPPIVLVAATTVVFPFTGEQPMPAGRLWVPLVACVALGWAGPRGRGLGVVRRAAAVYAVGVVLSFLVASPVGTNVERLVGVAGPPVLLAALASVPMSPSRGARAGVRAVALAGALVFVSGWLADRTGDDLRASTAVPAWAEHTDGVVAALHRLGAGRTRVEVVPARDHREAVLLAPYVNLARGWNRQLDVERGRLFYGDGPTPAAYRAWLERWAVGLVVLHDGRPDGPAEAEAALVRLGAGGLEQVWRGVGWRIYRVRGAVPLVSAPGTVVRGDDASLVVRMPAAGSVTVRITPSPWLRAGGGGCVRAEGGWTRLTVRRGGEYRLDAPYRLRPYGSCRLPGHGPRPTAPDPAP
ncbi:hypothetical protein ABT097_03050 [Streptomyces sp. NPDC002225]|uniref:hypothetical protein n=1 Tax=Streptomyces sp. NPDC002225 TaxID=3154413 RepID=UPI00332EF2E0